MNSLGVLQDGRLTMVDQVKPVIPSYIYAHVMQTEFT